MPPTIQQPASYPRLCPCFCLESEADGIVAFQDRQRPQLQRRPGCTRPAFAAAATVLNERMPEKRRAGAHGCALSATPASALSSESAGIQAMSRVYHQRARPPTNRDRQSASLRCHATQSRSRGLVDVRARRRQVFVSRQRVPRARPPCYSLTPRAASSPEPRCRNTRVCCPITRGAIDVPSAYETTLEKPPLAACS